VNSVDVGQRPLAGIIGAVVPSIVALPSSWLDLPVTGIAAYGIPIGAFVGFAMAPA